MGKKDCFVHIVKMSQRECEIYHDSDEIIVKNFVFKIRDGVMSIGDNKQYSTNNTFSIALKKSAFQTLDRIL